MRYAIGDLDARLDATPAARARCPVCKEAVMAKCGEIVTWHWAHLASDDCDPWSEPETVWHRTWQDVVPPHQREVVIGKHRADVVTPDGWVVELQHSSLSVADIRAREDHYGRMVWIFDATGAYDDDRIWPRHKGSHVTFRWKHPRKSVAACRKPVLLDFGTDELMALRRIYLAAPCGGWGHLVKRDQIESFMRGTQVANAHNADR